MSFPLRRPSQGQPQRRKKEKSKIMLTRQARQMEDTHETTHAKRDAASLGEWCMCDVAQ